VNFRFFLFFSLKLLSNESREKRCDPVLRSPDLGEKDGDGHLKDLAGTLPAKGTVLKEKKKGIRNQAKP